MREQLDPCWGNCGLPDDEKLLADNEILEIDTLEKKISPLDDNLIDIRKLITRFESCYYEADKEAESIIRAIGTGKLPVEPGERSPERKCLLQDSLDILTAWRDGDTSQCANLSVGDIPADELLSHLGPQNPLKAWQVERMIEKLKMTLDYESNTYHNMELSIDGYGQPIDINADGHFKDHPDFLKATTSAMIQFKFNGQDDEISLALGIDLFRPCNWNYVNNLVVILKAIGGNLEPDETFAPCCINKELTCNRDRLKVISNTLNAFWQGRETKNDVDNELLALLGRVTDQKRWLAACLDKTIRLHQGF